MYVLPKSSRSELLAGLLDAFQDDGKSAVVLDGQCLGCAIDGNRIVQRKLSFAKAGCRDAQLDD